MMKRKTPIQKEMILLKNRKKDFCGVGRKKMTAD